MAGRGAEGTDDFVDVGFPFTGQVGAEAFSDLEGDVGIEEEGGADGEAGSASEEEFDRVLPALNAPHADDGDVVFFGDFSVDAVGEEDGDGFDGGAREAAGAVGEHGALMFDIDDHRGEGVDEGEASCAGVDGGLGGDGDVGDVGGEFDDELAAFGDFFNGGDEFEEACRVGAEGEAVFDVGAGDVEFDSADDFFFVKAGGDVDVVFGTPAGDIDDDGDCHIFKQRDLVAEEGFEADVGEADGIQHAGAGFDDAIAFVAFAGGFGDGFGDEGAEF